MPNPPRVGRIYVALFPNEPVPTPGVRAQAGAGLYGDDRTDLPVHPLTVALVDPDTIDGAPPLPHLWIDGDLPDSLWQEGGAVFKIGRDCILQIYEAPNDDTGHILVADIVQSGWIESGAELVALPG